VGFEWDEESKAGIDFRRHGVRMREAISVFGDPYAITIADDESDSNEQRFVTLGTGAAIRLLVVVHVPPNRTSTTSTRQNYEKPLRFQQGKRGSVLPPEPESQSKTRITIRLDKDVVDRFFEMAEQSGGATGYQTLINAALREYLDGKAPSFEDTLRRIIREELKSNPA